MAQPRALVIGGSVGGLFAANLLRTIGWDVALLPDRPVVLEGNAWWGATGDPDGALVAVRDALRAAVEDPAG